ncbi:thyroid receptor-interacting, partial [Lynx pardinus]
VTIRELEHNRNEEIDDHQLEKAVLQNVYQQTLAEIRCRYHQKSKGYGKRIKELENLLEKDDSGIRAADESVIEDMQNTIQVLQTEKVESTRKIEELEDTIKYINSKLSSVESERDALRREWDRIDEEKKERIEECESQPSVLRQ